MAKNPWLSLWLSAANTWTGAARGFWTAEMHRQQKAMFNEMTRPKLSVLDQRLAPPRKRHQGCEGKPKADHAIPSCPT